MAFDECSGHCPNCDRQVLIRRRGCNHVLHLILTLCTFSLWVIVWILCAMLKGPWRCTRCGGIVSLRGPSPAGTSIVVKIAIALIALLVLFGLIGYCVS